MLEDIIAERKRKLAQYAAVYNPYPIKVHRNKTIAWVTSHFDEASERTPFLVLVGRVLGTRDQGSILFADVRDGTGQIQFVFNKEQAKDFALVQQNLDIGDFIEGRGSAFLTARGEKSLQIHEWRIITKTLRPLPSTWHGLEDAETRLRKRYLDFLLRPETAELFRKKSTFWNSVRNFLLGKNFFELEMPILESIPGGAEAEPFVTHHNALDRDFYLRISLELPLKKMLVGGLEKVFEIGRIFRNEGIDREHLQDYTQMECYWAYADHMKMMKLVEKLFRTVIQKTLGTLSHAYQSHQIDWEPEWETVDYYEVFMEKTGIDLKKTSLDELRLKAKEFGISVEDTMGKGRVIDLIYKKKVRSDLVRPCFLVNPPVEVEPLAKRLQKDPNRVARFQVVAGGTELGKGFSELNDPLDQRRRFEEQMQLREQGDEEAQRLDEDFLEALEYGMPPAAGFGISERLFSFLMDKPVRETVVFPLMKEEAKD